MKGLKMPKNPHKGLKVYCKECKKDNSRCSHFDSLQYRVRIHVKGTKKKVKSKTFLTKDYKEAVKQAINFEQELQANDYETPKTIFIGNNYSVVDAVIKYHQYLSGTHALTQMRKNVSNEYKDECIRYCSFFVDILKKNYDITKMRIADVNKHHVPEFYSWAEEHYAPKTFNKCMAALKAFFDFLIDIEDVTMKNPFNAYQTRYVPKTNIATLTREEFERIIKAVETSSPIKILGGKCEKKNMYRPYLIEGFKLFLLTGGRREEVVDLRWSDIMQTVKNVRFFRIQNLKTQRIKKVEDVFRFIPINADLLSLLEDMGFDSKKGSNEPILYPERGTILAKTIMNDLSKAFTHYKEAAGITKNVSLKNLRKTYISWVHEVMQKETGILTSHSTYEVLVNHYIDPTIISAIEKGAQQIKIFGT